MTNRAIAPVCASVALESAPSLASSGDEAERDLYGRFKGKKITFASMDSQALNWIVVKTSCRKNLVRRGAE